MTVGTVEKMAASRIGAVRCWRDMRALFHVRVPNPAPLGYDQDQFLTQNWFKTTQRPTQRSHPSIWVEKNNPACFRVYFGQNYA